MGTRLISEFLIVAAAAAGLTLGSGKLAAQTSTEAEQQVGSLMATAEIPGISAHSLRHTSASLGIESGEPIHHVRDRLGHSSIVVTEKYLHAHE